MNDFKYTLEKTSKKHICPDCGKKRFVRYIDKDNGSYLPDIYGRCDREISCGYNRNPYKDKYFNYNNDFYSGRKIPQLKKQILNKLAFIPKPILKHTLRGYEDNKFINNLLHNIPYPFESTIIEKVVELYLLGTIVKGYRKGAITFPFIDTDKNVRTIQVKQFDKNNHTTSTDFLHSIIERHYIKKGKDIPQWLKAYKANELKVSCLFGEHLLNEYPNNPVALVEAPKTAIYCTLYFGLPSNANKLLWLAVYNLSSLNYEKCKVLEGRNVVLFPDLSQEGKAFKLWSNKAKELNELMADTGFQVSDFLEKHCIYKDKEKGKDIADYLINMDWKKFQSYEREKTFVHKTESPQNDFIPSFSNNYVDLSADTGQSTGKDQENWDIEGLEKFFSETPLPEQPLRVNSFSVITDVKKYVDSHIIVIKHNKGIKAYKPYYERLLNLKELLQ